MNRAMEYFNVLVTEFEEYFDREFVDEAGKEYVFYGIVYGKDDLYYGMHPIGDGKPWLLSCVGSLEGHGFKLKEEINE